MRRNLLFAASVGSAKSVLCVVLWGLACLQATFLLPYVVLVPGDRTNLFTTVIVSLPGIALAASRSGAIGWASVVPWLLLAAGLVASACVSPDPFASTMRGIAFWLPAASGLFCAYELSRYPSAKTIFFTVFSLCFAGLTVAHLVFGSYPSFLGFHHHALAGALLLLAAGPIYYLFTGSIVWRLVAGSLLVLGYVVCFLAGSRFTILLPFILIPTMVFLLRISWRWAIAGLAASTVIAAIFFAVYPVKVMKYTNYESTFYRVEGVPAAIEIMKQHPWLGIGIRTPRREYLEHFDPPFGSADKETFLSVVDINITSDNQYLSLPVGIGIPFALLYFGLISNGLLAYLRRAKRGEVDSGTERALTFALLATLAHFLIYDGLFYPQISWFFHLLLGVAVYSLKPSAESRPLYQDNDNKLDTLT